MDKLLKMKFVQYAENKKNNFVGKEKACKNAP